MEVIFNQYLEGLKKVEAEKPVVKRRRIPSTREFAEHIGITPTGFSKITNNRTKALSKHFMGGTITLLRSCGFSTTFNDILEYELELEPESKPKQEAPTL